MTDPQPPAGQLRPLTEADLGLVRSWRNHPSVRDFMYNRHEISADEHTAWFTAATGAPGRHLLVYEEDGNPAGFVSFGTPHDATVADWGFYTAPTAPRGTGRRLGVAALNLAFHALSLHKVCGEALAFNTASLRFHEALGFTREGLLREQHFDGERYHDVIRYGLLAHEWPSPPVRRSS